MKIKFGSYYNSTKRLDKLEKFVEKSVRIENSSSHKRLARVRNFFRSFKNLIFGDHRWYSLSRARSILRVYLSENNKALGNPDLQEKIKSIYLQLEKLKRKKFLKKIEPAFVARFGYRPINNTLDGDNTKIPGKKSKQKIVEQKLRKTTTFERNAAFESLIPHVDYEKLPPVTSSLLFGLHANEFGQGSQLEKKDSPADTLAYISSYMLARFEKGGKISENDEEIIRLLKGAERIANSKTDPKVIVEEIENAFKMQKSCLIPGGWVDPVTLNTVFIEIIPEGDQATLKLFNSSSQQRTIYQAGVKDKIRSFSWKKIQKNKLLDPLFLKALHELNHTEKHPDSKVSSAAYTYNDLNALKRLLGVKQKNSSAEEVVEKVDLSSLQKAHVSSFLSLMSFLSTKMSKNELQRLKCDLRIQALMTFPATRASGGDATEWRLIQKSLQKLSRKIHHLYKSRVVTAEFQKNARQKLSLVKDWISSEKKFVFKKAAFKFGTFKAPSGYLSLDELVPIAQLDTVKKGSSSTINSSSYSYLNDKLKTLTFLRQDTIQDELKKALKYLSIAKDNRESQAVCFGATSVIERLPRDKAFWQPFTSDPKQRDEILLQLDKLSKLLFEACFHKMPSNIVFPETLVALHKLNGIQWQVAQVATEKVSNFRPIALPHLLFQLPNEALLKDYKDNRYVFDSDNPLFRVCLDGKKCTPASYGVKDAARDLKLFEELISRFDPDGLAKMIKKVPMQMRGIQYAELDDKTRYLMLFSSQQLPWQLKALRETHLRLHYLTYYEPQASGTLTTPEFDLVSPKPGSVKFSLRDHTSIKATHHATERKMSSLQMEGIKVKPPLFYSEKKLLTADLSRDYPNLSNEETKEIAHLFINDSVGVIAALEYFERHSAKISDPDYQFIFKAACFRPGAIASLDEGASRLSYKFIKKYLDQALNQQDFGTAVFLMRMHRYFNRFNVYAEYGSLLDGQKVIEDLLLKTGLQVDEKSGLYAELAAYISEKNEVTERELKNLVIAKTWISLHSLSGKWHDPRTDEEIEKGFYKHSRAITDLLLPGGTANEVVLKEILKEISTQYAAASWHATCEEGKELVFSTKEHDIFYPLKGKIYTLDQQTVLPLEIRENNTFKALFPAVLQGVALPLGVYSFKDENGDQVRLKTEDPPASRKEAKQEKKSKQSYEKSTTLVIEKQIQGKWYRYLPASKFLKEVQGDKKIYSSYLQSRKLTEDFTHWQSLDDSQEILCLTKSAKTPVYQIKKIYEKSYFLDEATAKKQGRGRYVPERELLHIDRLSDGMRLSVANKGLTDFEDASYIHCWYQKERLAEIELPRYGLTFVADQKSPEKFICRNYPGFVLAANQTVEALGACKTHLVLEDGSGNKKLLLPNLQLERLDQKENPETLLPKLSYHRYLEKKPQSTLDFYEYSLDSKGNIKASTRAASYYLAYTLAANQEYPLAAKYLQQFGEKPTSYSPKEVAALQGLTKINKFTRDASGELKAISLYAAYLLSLNAKSEKIGKKSLEKHYLQYLQGSNHITSLKLKKEEELRIVKNLFSKAPNPYFYARLRILDPKYALKNFYQNNALEKPGQNHVFEKPGERLLLKDLLKGVNLYRFGKKRFNEKTAFSKSITRPEIRIKTYLLDYIKYAINGTAEQKKWILTATHFMQSQASQETKALGFLFKYIMENPVDIKLLPTEHLDNENYNKKVQEWWKDVLEKISDVYMEISPSSTDLIKIGLSDFAAAEIESETFDIHFAPSFTATESLSIQLNLPQFLLKQDRLPTMNEQEYKEVDAWVERQQKAIDQQKNPLLYLEYERLRNDLKIYKNMPAAETYRLNSSVDAIEVKLNEGRLSEKKQLEQLENQMKAIVNIADDDRVFKLWGGLERKISLDDIFVSYAQKNPSALQALNPQLSQDHFNNLYSLANEYLQISALKKQKERCLAACQMHKKAPPEEKLTLENKLIDELLAKRNYDVKDHPAYLVFEYYENILMRADQVEKLKDFLEGKSVNPVREMIMGSGKSKVLLPLLGLLRANKKDLSLLIVPPPLFESIASDTQKKMNEVFNKSLRTLHFDRNSTFTKRSLEEIRDLLVDTIDNQECLIMTNKSVCSLLLKFIEHTEILYKKGAIEDENTPLMREIIDLLSVAGYPLIDEADTVLSILHEVSFSLGKITTPKEEEAALTGELYHLLYTDPTIKALARLESDPSPDEKAPAFTKDLYETKIKPLLAVKLVERLKSANLQNPTITKVVNEFFESLSANDQGLLLNYLCRDQDRMVAAQAYFDTLPTSIKNVIALAGEEICHLLPHTLIKTEGENFGLDDNVYAIPFAAVNTPNVGSIYSVPYITMNNTFASHYKNGISKDTLKKVVEKLASDAEREKQELGISLTETMAWATFMSIKGNVDFPLLKFEDHHLEALQNHINSSPEAKRQLIVSQIFSKIEIYSKKLSCNPMAFTSLFSKIDAFTGTLMSAGSMHRKLTPVPEAGTDAKTFLALWRMKNTPVIKCPSGPMVKLIEFLKVSGEKFDLISDAGGYLKEGNNESISQKLMDAFKKPVAYYNSKGEQSIREAQGSTSLAESSIVESERIAFLDQSRTVGADISVRAAGVGLVTIGRNMTLRDLFQAVWRLRGLGKGQTVKYLINEDVQSIIRQKNKLATDQDIGFPEILAFVIQNQCEKQGSDNFKAFKQELYGMVQYLLIANLKDETLSKNDRLNLYGELRSHWIKPQNKSAADKYGKPEFLRQKEEVVDEEAKKCRELLENIGVKLPFIKEQVETCLKEIAPLCQKYMHIMHPYLSSQMAEDSETSEVEQATDSEVHSELINEMMTVNHDDKKKLGSFDCPTFYNYNLSTYCSTNKLNRDKVLKEAKRRWINEEELWTYEGELLENYQKDPISEDHLPEDHQKLIRAIYKRELKKTNISLQDFFNAKNTILSLEDEMQKTHLGEYAHLFKGISMVTNVLEWDEGVKNLEDAKLLSDYRPSFHYLRVEGDDVTLLTTIEAEFSNYNLYLGFTKKKQSPLTEKAFKKIVKLKFLNGECDFYNKKELAYLEKWITKAGAEKMRQFFMRTILKNRPHAQSMFSTSPLAAIFNRMKKITVHD